FVVESKLNNTCSISKVYEDKLTQISLSLNPSAHGNLSADVGCSQVAAIVSSFQPRHKLCHFFSYLLYFSSALDRFISRNTYAMRRFKLPFPDELFLFFYNRRGKVKLEISFRFPSGETFILFPTCKGQFKK